MKMSSWDSPGAAWALLVVAGLFETVWAVALKQSEGFTRLWPSLATVAAMALSVALLGLAMRTLPVGTAYPAWTGIGAVGAVVLGVAWLGEPAGVGRLACIALILAGVIGLKLAAPH